MKISIADFKRLNEILELEQDSFFERYKQLKIFYEYLALLPAISALFKGHTSQGGFSDIWDDKDHNEIRSCIRRRITSHSEQLFQIQ